MTSRDRTDAPLTERQAKIMELLADGSSRTAADIAHGIGIHTGPARRRGPWSGRMSPAQHVIGSLTGLDRRGLVTLAARPDGLSGTAYRKVHPLMGDGGQG